MKLVTTGAPQWVSVSDACQRWGIGKTTLYGLLQVGHPERALIASFTLGRKRLISVKSGDAYFAGLLAAQNEGGHQ